MILIAILLPPLVFFLIGRFFAGIISTVLYIIATIIAFTGVLLPISFIIYLALMIWAIVARNNSKTEKKMKEMERRIITNQITNEEH
jgi:uncharacterized paraquat-inducible protein A